MRIVKTAVAVFAGGLLLGAGSGPAWPASAEPAPQTAQVDTVPRSDSNSLLGMINSVLIRSEIHQGQVSCQATKLYSQHDVVGDQQSCFMNKIGDLGFGAAE
jgi:hypothetical protein